MFGMLCLGWDKQSSRVLSQDWETLSWACQISGVISSGVVQVRFSESGQLEQWDGVGWEEGDGWNVHH